jgi:hypothetical protein
VTVAAVVVVGVVGMRWCVVGVRTVVVMGVGQAAAVAMAVAVDQFIGEGLAGNGERSSASRQL